MWDVPERIPIIKDEITSFVTKASPIAIIGGKTDKKPTLIDSKINPPFLSKIYFLEQNLTFIIITHILSIFNSIKPAYGSFV